MLQVDTPVNSVMGAELKIFPSSLTNFIVGTYYSLQHVSAEMAIFR